MAGLQRCLESKKFTLIVSLPANDENLAAAALQEGADALKVHCNVNHPASGTLFGPLREYETVFHNIRSQFKGPLGIVPAGSVEGARFKDIALLAAMGFDYYSIYAHHLPSFMMNESAMDRTFAISDQYDLNLVKSARRFGFTALEAAIIPGSEYGTPLSFADVMKYRYLVETVQIPVIVPSQRKLVPHDISVLHDAGVKAVMLGAVVVGRTVEQMRKAVADIRNAIDRLT